MGVIDQDAVPSIRSARTASPIVKDDAKRVGGRKPDFRRNRVGRRPRDGRALHIALIMGHFLGLSRERSRPDGIRKTSYLGIREGDSQELATQKNPEATKGLQ